MEDQGREVRKGKGLSRERERERETNLAGD